MSEQVDFTDQLEEVFANDEAETEVLATDLGEVEIEPEPEVNVVEIEEPTTYRIGDREFTAEQVQPVLQFADWANENPEGWKQLQEWEEGKLTFAPVEEPVYEGEPEYEPEYFDEDHQRKLAQQVEQIQAELARRTYTEAASAVDDGVNAFLSSHSDLTDDDVESVMGFVADRGALMSIPEDLPYAQKAAAVAQRLEEARRVVFYDRSKSEGTREAVRDLEKRRRASSSSSSVSAPRVSPAPENKQERHMAFVDEIKAALEEASN